MFILNNLLDRLKYLNATKDHLQKNTIKYKEKVKEMPSNFAEITAERIAKLRRERKMTQSQLAEKLGVSRSCIANWERCIREPNAADVCSLASFFNVSTEYICGRTDLHNKIKIPEPYNIDLSVLNAMGKKMFMEYYRFLIQNESFTNKT